MTQEIINIREYNELLIKKGLEMMKNNATKDTTIAEKPQNALKVALPPKVVVGHSPKEKDTKKPLKR